MKKRKKIYFAVFFAVFFACFPLAVSFYAHAQMPPLSQRELNTQNMALNRCEQFLKAGRMEDATKCFDAASELRRATELNPNYKRVADIFISQRKEYIKKLMDEGNNLFMARKYVDAKKLFKKIISVNPENAQADDKIKLCEEQIKLLERVRETHHDSKIDVTALEKIDFEELKKTSMRALALLKLKKLKEALNLFKECHKKDSHNPYFADKIKFIEGLLNVLKISTSFNAAVAKNFRDPTCEVMLGELDTLDGQFQLRLAALEDRELSRHLNSIGEYFFLKQKYAQAENVLKKCIEFVGDRNEIRYLLGKIYYHNNQPWLSYQKFKILQSSQELDPAISMSVKLFYYELMFRIYKLLFLTMFFQSCMMAFMAYRGFNVVDYAYDGMITRFFTLSMREASYYYEKGMVYINKGDYKGALTNLRKCVSLDKTNVKAFYNIGFSLYKLKEYEKARIEFETLLKAMPNHQRAAYYLALLYDSVKLQKEAIRMLELARGIAVTSRSFSNIEIDKNRGLYLETFQEYKLSADKILGLNEDVITPADKS
ncbi:MAG TPA: tetratricopeptide repeat protein [Candidatus Wallbacteria bacterium]|nr:tetratricopeptide repeat protein [Candidatus Wallbacteria bacterium]